MNSSIYRCGRRSSDKLSLLSGRFCGHTRHDLMTRGCVSFVVNSRYFCQKASEVPHRPSADTKVLYDGNCKICMVEIAGLKCLSRNKPVSFINISDDGYKAEENSGVTYENAMKEMHVIDPEGKVLIQGDAIRHMYRVSGLGWLASLTEMPGVRGVCDKAYIRFAEYRLNKALDACDSGSCSIKLQDLRRKYRDHT